MAYRDTHESLLALHGIATGQGGYFTAKQAAGAGYDYHTSTTISKPAILSAPTMAYTASSRSLLLSRIN